MAPPVRSHHVCWPTGELVLVVPVKLAAEPGCSVPGRVADRCHRSHAIVMVASGWPYVRSRSAPALMALRLLGDRCGQISHAREQTLNRCAGSWTCSRVEPR
jgi:hypothetical protein